MIITTLQAQPTRTEIKTLAVQLLKEHKATGSLMSLADKGWRFEFNSRKRAMGLCCFSTSASRACVLTSIDLAAREYTPPPSEISVLS